MNKSHRKLAVLGVLGLLFLGVSAVQARDRYGKVRDIDRAIAISDIVLRALFPTQVVVVEPQPVVSYMAPVYETSTFVTPVYSSSVYISPTIRYTRPHYDYYRPSPRYYRPQRYHQPHRYMPQPWHPRHDHCQPSRPRYTPPRHHRQPNRPMPKSAPQGHQHRR